MEDSGKKAGARKGIWSTWKSIPLYWRIIGGLAIGLALGLSLGPNAAPFGIPAKLVLRLLGAIAPPLVLLAIVRSLLSVHVEGKTGWRMIGLLILNTLVAIVIGLSVANIIQPGKFNRLPPPPEKHEGPHAQNILEQFLENVPKSLLGPLADNGKVIGVIFLAIAFGLALRAHRDRPLNTLRDWIDVAFESVITILHAIIEIIPFAVCGIVASIVGESGLGAFRALGMFVVAVLIALIVQATYYLVRIRFGSWVRPLNLLRGVRDALVMAFSTGSSTATMPVTYECAKTRVGVREPAVSLGVLVGSNFNNDGTALYEAMAALFVSQMIGIELNMGQQLMVVLTSVIASVGAAGIPEAGLVTMTLVFSAVGLPVEYIGILLTVDWFLDRCRTAINVMGDLNVACLLDGKTPPAESASEQAIAAPAI
jgi:Na+/H+-dicarboxylate symporter